MTPVAGLPMYDLPGLADWHAAWWGGLARHLRAAGVDDVPTTLSRLDTPALWSHPRLLFAQACGYPLMHAYAGRLRILATPCYAAPGCAGSDYASAIVVREASRARTLKDMLGGRLAVNDPDSQSGCNAVHASVAVFCHGGPPFGRLVITGSHIASLRAVREGVADVCAVDAVTHALLARHTPDSLRETRVLAWSERTPGLPYVTRRSADDETVQRLRDGLFAALSDPALSDVREALLISGAELRDLADYRCIRAMAKRARARCPALAGAVTRVV